MLNWAGCAPARPVATRSNEADPCSPRNIGSSCSVSFTSDDLLVAFVRKKLGVQAIGLYLDLSRDQVLHRAGVLGLRAPPDKTQIFRHGGWTVACVRKLLELVRHGFCYREIGERLGRSGHAVGAKARRLGLYRRCPDKNLSLSASRQPVTWGETLDDELSNRWFADQHHKAIGREMEISAGAIRSRATRLGLPRRDRTALVDHFDRERSASSPLRASLVRRTCLSSGIRFWGTQNGPRTSPLVRKSRRFQLLNSGFSEASTCMALCW